MATRKLCSIPDCGKPARARGWCNMHHHRWKAHGDPQGGGAERPRRGPICSIDECGKKHYSHGFCVSHYRRWLKHGDPCGGSAANGETLRYYLGTVLTYTGKECLAWPYSRSDKGYGKFRYGGKFCLVPRIVCEHFNGPPPTPDHQAAHSCGKGHEGCVTPGHLSWKTPKGNAADRIIHGTHNKGERNGRWKHGRYCKPSAPTPG